MIYIVCIGIVRFTSSEVIQIGWDKFRAYQSPYGASQVAASAAVRTLKTKCESKLNVSDLLC